MRENITQQLRDFWDAGIRGPDFVWAATGPALEAFSKYPVVKKATAPGEQMSVSEFLRQVRRMVVDFVVGRVMTQDGAPAPADEPEAVTGLDDVTTYYLLHRHDFGMEEAPVGGCILYALSCNLSDAALVNQHDLLTQPGKRGAADEFEEEGEEAPEEAEETGGGAKVKLKPWHRRKGRNLGLEGQGGTARAADRPGAQAHAPLARRGPGEGQRLPRQPWPAAQRPVQPDPAGAHRAGRRRLGGALAPGVGEQPLGRAGRGSGPRAEAARVRNNGPSTGASPMITSVRLVNFKNFADETLRVGPFTVIVGANASGKSNIRDAFRFLHGIGRGYTLAEIIGGKYGADWKPIRGAANEIVQFGQSGFSIEAGIQLEDADLCYLIEVGYESEQSEFRITREKLTGRIKPGHARDYQSFTLNSNPDRSTSEPTPTDEYPLLFRVFLSTSRRIQEKFGSALEVMGEPISISPPSREFLEPYIQQTIDTLADMRFLEPSPERMREPTLPGHTVLGDSGENLAAALDAICSDAGRKNVLTAWLRELTPMDVRDLRFPRDPSGRVHLQVLEGNERAVSAYSASDGTLRFLAMLAALLGTKPAGLYFFEESDNGIHPVRLNLLTDLIERQTAKNGVQVLTTTHAPTLLTVMNDGTFENTSVVCRLEGRSDAIIRPVSELPSVQELRQDQGLGRLHESGWMEDALFFTEDYDPREDGS